MSNSQNIFQTEDIDLIEHQSIIPRLSYNLSNSNDTVSQTPKNSDFLMLLQQLIDDQKKIVDNQSTLSQGQASIVQNQEQLAQKLEAIEASAVVKPEMMAQAKIMMECKVGLKRVQESLCRMTGETTDKGLDAIASMLPLRTIIAVQEIEEKLDSDDYAQAMNSYIHKLKGVSENVGSVIRALFTDELLDKYNWDGRWGKLPLAKLTLLNKIARDVFQNLGAFEYEKSFKKEVERAHHRVKQKKYIKEKDLKK